MNGAEQMSKTVFPKLSLLLLVVPMLSACLDLGDAAVGAAGVVIADTLIENQNGGDGLF